MISKQARYFIGYLTFSVLSLSYAIQDSYMNSSSYYALLLRLTDGVNLGIVLNFTLCCFICLSTLCQRVIFGELRLIEQEHVIEKFPIYIVSLLLNLTTRDNNLLLNVLLVMISLFSKVMHLILRDRVEFRNTKILNELVNSSSYNYKVVLKAYLSNIFNTWNLVFAAVDFLVAKLLVYDVFQGINSVPCLLFGFQFAVQGLELLTIFSKLLIDIYELIFYPATSDDEFDVDQEAVGDDDCDEQVWESKGYYVKSIEIIACLLRVGSYLVFIYLLGIHAGSSVPLSMIQGVFVSARESYKEFKKLLTFMEQSKKLDSQLADATDEDLQSDNLCTICRDDMRSVDEFERVYKKKMSPRRKPKKINCGHILHMGCLKDWLERSDNCPLCRRKVFNHPGDSPQTNTNTERPAEPAQQVPNFNPAGNNNNNQGLFRPVNPLVGRFQEFDEILRRTRDGGSGDTRFTHENQLSTRDQSQHLGRQIPPVHATRTTDLSTENDMRYQSISLPNTAIIPPNWTILPLERADQGNYTVHYSRASTGTLRTESKTRGRSLVLIDSNLTTSHETPTVDNNNENNDLH